MYLFTKTILSSCPHEDYCCTMTVLALLTLIIQIVVAVMLLKEWKTTKSSYAKFLTVVRTCHVFYTFFCFVIGEIRTLFPRKTIICYGIIRYLGDYGCGVLFHLVLTFLLVEIYSVVYAFNGQYNIMCRKVGFYDNTYIQKTSFIIFGINNLIVFIILNFALLSRKEAITLWYTFDKTMQIYLKEHYAIIGYGGSKDYLLLILVLFVTIIVTVLMVHYFVILKIMIKFIRELHEHNKQTSIKNDYVTELNNHIVKSLLPFILLFWPLIYVIIIIIFFNGEKYYSFTISTTNTIPFFVIIYLLASALYVIYFKYRSYKRTKQSNVEKKLFVRPNTIKTRSK
uniref:G-protein coupled receptors family 1 profile domain-containing protein n=1 Tax=Strongyloides stercoralis TaxID=6248 RepID=A0A0K0DZ05_STRER